MSIFLLFSDFNFHIFSSLEIKVETNGFDIIGTVDKDVNYICLSLVTYNISTKVKAAFQKVAIQPFSNDPQLSYEGSCTSCRHFDHFLVFNNFFEITL